MGYRVTSIIFVGIVTTCHFPITVETLSTIEPSTTTTPDYIPSTITDAENDTESNCTSSSESVTTLPCAAHTTAILETSMTTAYLTTNATASATTITELPTSTITDKSEPNGTSTTNQSTLITVKPLTTTTNNKLASNALSVSYPLRDHSMYISASFSIYLESYNDSLKPELIAQFIAEMGTLLKNTTGFAGIQVTRVYSNIVDTIWVKEAPADSSTLSLSQRMKRTDNKAITLEYTVLLIGDTDLYQTINTMPDSPRNISLLGDNTFLIDWEQIEQAINTTIEALQSNACLVFRDVDNCRAGFSCRRESVDIVCSHVCLNEAKCGVNGVCYFDEIVNNTMCRCKENDGLFYTGMDCNVEAYKLALPLGAVIGISAGLGGALLLVILVLLVRVMRKSRTSVGKPENNTFDREMANWKRTPNNEDHRLTEERRSDLNLRHLRSSQDSVPHTTYMYPYNSQTEAKYVEPGSSLSNLNFPEFKFEISRPKLVLGRNGRY